MGVGRTFKKIKKVANKAGKFISDNPELMALGELGISMVPGGSAALTTGKQAYSAGKRAYKMGDQVNQARKSMQRSAVDSTDNMQNKIKREIKNQYKQQLTNLAQTIKDKEERKLAEL